MPETARIAMLTANSNPRLACRMITPSYAEFLSRALDVDCVVADRFRRNFFPPMRRFRGNRDDVALAQGKCLPSFDLRHRHLVGGGPLGADHRSARDKRRLSIDYDEDVVGMLMIFDSASFP